MCNKRTSQTNQFEWTLHHVHVFGSETLALDQIIEIYLDVSIDKVSCD